MERGRSLDSINIFLGPKDGSIAIHGRTEVLVDNSKVGKVQRLIWDRFSNIVKQEDAFKDAKKERGTRCR